MQVECRRVALGAGRPGRRTPRCCSALPAPAPAAAGPAEHQRHRDVVPHRHRGERPRDLVGPRHPAVGDPVRRPGRRGRWPAMRIASARGPQRPGEQADERGLAGPVGPDQADDLALAIVSVTPVERPDTAEVPGHLPALDDHRARPAGGSPASPAPAPGSAGDRPALGRAGGLVSRPRSAGAGSPARGQPARPARAERSARTRHASGHEQRRGQPVDAGRRPSRSPRPATTATRNATRRPRPRRSRA